MQMLATGCMCSCIFRSVYPTWVWMRGARSVMIKLCGSSRVTVVCLWTDNCSPGEKREREKARVKRQCGEFSGVRVHVRHRENTC